MLPFACAATPRPTRSALFAGAVFALAAVAPVVYFATARAQEITSGGCTNSSNSFNCVTRWAPAGDPFTRQVPQPVGEAARARARELDRRWVDRCQPVIRQDRYGVPRYHYAMPGCEFGVGEY